MFVFLVNKNRALQEAFSAFRVRIQTFVSGEQEKKLKVKRKDGFQGLMFSRLMHYFPMFSSSNEIIVESIRYNPPRNLG